MLTYQQTLNESSDIVCHAGGPGVAGRQLDQSHQEVLALLDTFQGLLWLEVIHQTQLLTLVRPIRQPFSINVVWNKSYQYKLEPGLYFCAWRQSSYDAVENLKFCEECCSEIHR